MREAVKCVNRSTRPTAQFKINVWTRWLVPIFHKITAMLFPARRQRAWSPDPQRKHGGRVVLSQADGRARGMRRHSRSARLVYRPFESADRERERVRPVYRAVSSPSCNTVR